MTFSFLSHRRRLSSFTINKNSQTDNNKQALDVVVDKTAKFMGAGCSNGK